MPNMIDSECKIQSRAYLVKLFIENGADPNLLSPKVEHSPLHWLCYWGDWRAVKQLLKLNSLDKLKLGQKSLLSRKNPLELQNEHLAERGAFNSFQTFDGQTPIDIAGDKEHFKCVKYIIKHFLQESE
jgi:ankyrin repeat protein